MRVFVKLQLENGGENDACTSSCEFRTRPLLGLCSRRPGDCQLHWLPVQQQITYKLAVLQSLEHVKPGLPSRPNNGTCLQPNFMLMCIPLLIQPFTVLRLFCLFLNRDLKLFIHSGFQWTLLRPASKLQSLWSYDRMIRVV